MAMHEVIILSSSPPGTPLKNARKSQRGKRVSDEEFFDSYSPFIIDSKHSSEVQTNVSGGAVVTGNTDHRELLLLSSPSGQLSRSASGLEGNDVLNDNVFDDTDFAIEQPSKRRRLSPKPRPARSAQVLNDVDEVFDLSSEADRAFGEHHVLSSDNEDGPSLDLHATILPEDVSKQSLSAPRQSKNCRIEAFEQRQTDTLEILSDDFMVEHDPIISSSQQPILSNFPKYSAKTTALLENVNNSSKRTVGTLKNAHSCNTSVTYFAKATKSTKIISTVVEEVDNIIDSSPAQSAVRGKDRSSKPALADKSATKSNETSAKRKAEQDGKQIEKERKAKEREAAKELKKREKEQKAADKQRAADIAEVNKKKTNKKDSTQEMIIDLPMAFRGKSLGNKVEAKIQELDAQVSYYVDEINMTESDQTSQNLGNVVKWRRKVISTYDETIEEWVPLSRAKIVPEKHILVHLSAEDFCLIATRCDGEQVDSSNVAHPTDAIMQENLDAYIILLRSRHPECTIILLIEGLNLWLKKNVNAKNREYANAVRAQPNVTDDIISIPPATSKPSRSSNAASKKRKKDNSTELCFINSDVAEALMLHLQLCHQPLQIHHTIQSESWEQIVAFTQHLSTRPYRNVELQHNLTHASFCMTSGQFRTGQGDPLDTWIKMLEQVNRLTVGMAKGVVDEGYESPAQLVRGFEKVEMDACKSDEARAGKEKAKTMLQDVKRSRSDQRLGPMVSRRLYKIFMSQDEELRDGIA